MKYPCENCKLRAAYDKNPKSLIGRFWRWQINFCPTSGAGRSISVPAGEATLSRCHLRNRKRFARSMTFGSINDLI